MNFCRYGHLVRCYVNVSYHHRSRQSEAVPAEKLEIGEHLAATEACDKERSEILTLIISPNNNHHAQNTSQ